MPQQPMPVRMTDFDDDAGQEVPGSDVSARRSRHALVRSASTRPSSSRTRSNTVQDSMLVPIQGLARTNTQPPISGPGLLGQASTMGPPPLPRSSSTNRRAAGASYHQSTRSEEWRYSLPLRPHIAPVQPGLGGYHPAYSQPAIPTTAPEMLPHPRSNSVHTAVYGAPLATPMPHTRIPGPPPSRSAYFDPFQAAYAPGDFVTSPVLDTAPLYTPMPTAMPNMGRAAPYSTSIPMIPPYRAPPTVGALPPLHTAPPPITTRAPREVTTARVERHTARSPMSPMESRRFEYPSLNTLQREHTTPRHMPGSFPDEHAIDDDEEEQGYYSDDGYLEDRTRDFVIPSRHQMLPPQRPASAMPTISGRPVPPRTSSITEALDTNPRLVTYPDEQMPRPSAPRRHSSTRSSRSRQPSVSTVGSIRTPPTTISNDSQRPFVIVEDSKGNRRKQYVSSEDFERIKRFQAIQRAKQQRRVDDAEAYQNAVRGGAGEELTAENIRQMVDMPSAPKSRQSNRSKRSSQSAATEGIRIMIGETTLHLAGGTARVDLQSGEDGEPRIVINPGSSSGREKSYVSETSTKSSDSRAARSRGNSDRERELRRRSDRISVVK